MRGFIRTKATTKVVGFVMLCGKQRVKNVIDNRYLTNEILAKNREDVNVIYSEDLFHIIDENQNMDLLRFEELLVEISDGIIIFLESMGTASELGAFTYLDDLAKKTLVFVDSKYKNDNSFINGGPVKRIKSFSDSENNCDVIFTKFLDDGNVDFGDSLVYKKIVDFYKTKKPSFNRDNLDFKGNSCHISPSLLMYLIIDIVFVFEIVPRKELFDFLSFILNKNTSLFAITFRSQNSFDNEVVKNYIVEMLIKWRIISEIKSKKYDGSLLKINYNNFKNSKIATNFLGKTLFTKKAFEGRDYLKLKHYNRRYIRNKYGQVDEVNYEE